MLFVPLQLNFDPIQVKRKIPIEGIADRIQTSQKGAHKCCSSAIAQRNEIHV